jgi:hypothetical protein
VVRVTGTDASVDLVTGALGSTDLFPPLGTEVVLEYRLAPDSALLEVSTTITAPGGASVQPGDLLQAALEGVDPFDPRVGFDGPADSRPWTGFLGAQDDVAMAILSPEGDLATGGLEALSGVLNASIAFTPIVTLGAGESTSYTRWYAVGRDLAAITDAWYAATAAPTETVAGTVTAADGPVGGARVAILVDGAPVTMAITAADGTFSAEAPAGATALAVGAGTGRFADLAAGYAPISAASAPTVSAAALAALTAGAGGVPGARGRGFGTEADPLRLGVPASIRVSAADGLPFEVRVTALDPAPAADSRVWPGATGGYAAVGWARDGDVELLVPPGRYRVLMHRGIRFEVDEADVDVTNEGATLVADLPAAYSHAGWLLGDPHMHASPSSDASIPMEDRLIAAAAVGLQAHFGTDHDHVADYRPVVDALGLSDVLISVVADECSPVPRGHINLYPLERDGRANGGAWPWYSEAVASTDDQMTLLRARHPGVVVQVNHPLDSGLGASAGWSPGRVRDATRWTTNFDAVEVMNGASLEHLPFFVDLMDRGIVATPVGVSDAHGHLGAGRSATFFGVGSDDPKAFTNDALRETMAAGRTVATRGPFLTLSVAPGSLVTGSTSVAVKAWSPSWIRVDRLVLWRDGAPVQTVAGTEATFELAPEKDAWYAVLAEGDTPMLPVWGDTPWAMAAPIRVDVAGDGWTSPKGPITP